MKSKEKFRKLLIKLLTMTEKEIVSKIELTANENDYQVIKYPKFIIVRPIDPIGYAPLVCAHYDTVVGRTPTVIAKSDTISATGTPVGGDDRCGVAIALSLIQDKAIATFAFFDEEESGAQGSKSFLMAESWIAKASSCYIGLDRRGDCDAAVYSYESEELLRIVGKYGYKKAIGSMTDVSIIESQLPKATVNLSVGFYREHTAMETIVIKDTYNTYKNMLSIIDDIGEKLFVDIEDVYSWRTDFRETDRNYYENDFGVPHRQALQKLFEMDDETMAEIVQGYIDENEAAMDEVRFLCEGCECWNGKTCTSKFKFECIQENDVFLLKEIVEGRNPYGI